MRRFSPAFWVIGLYTSILGPGLTLAQGAPPAGGAPVPAGVPPFVVEEPKIPPAPSPKPSAAPSAKPSAAPQAAPAQAGEPLLTFQADTSGYATTAEIEGVLLTLEGLKSRIDQLESKLAGFEEAMKRVEATASNASRAGRAPTGGSKSSGELAEIKQKLQDLSSKYQSHSHDYLIEVKERGGGVGEAQQGSLQGGQSATGRVKIGKPK